MQADIRNTDLYREAESLYRYLRQPGTGQISDAIELSAHGRYVVFAGTLVESLEGMPPTRICLTDLETGDTKVLTFGPNTDRLPKFSPDGSSVAFLSDRHRGGDFQLHLLDPATGAARPAASVEGWVEYLHWSPDGSKVLLGVAGHGADVSGGQGAVASEAAVSAGAPSWMPSIETGNEAHRWRRVWVYEVETRHARCVTRAECNVWEAAWCGDDAIVAVVSSGPIEGFWYAAELHKIDLNDGSSRVLHVPQDQLGWPAGSPCGRRVAFVEAICSDRWVVAGDARLIDLESGRVELLDTKGVDVTHTEWRSERILLLAGHRGGETVVLRYDVSSRFLHEVWTSDELSTGGFHASVSGLDDSGDCVFAGRGFHRAPEIACIRQGVYRAIKSLDLGYAQQAQVIREIRYLAWKASDDLEIQGWLLRPEGEGPHPLVMVVHGGPVWHWRPMWLGVLFLLLLERGYALFFPNPRGSSGRGRAFARHVVGDMGGADATDCLSGLDFLVAEGLADRKRLGVTGGSYGGFMSSWLITQDSRFAAAVPVSPVTNQVTQHLISNIPHFVSLFLCDTYTNPGGKYFQRSPVMHAHRATTPTLNICGAKDRCTPPEEAIQFHNALRENGTKSVLVLYPQEGHGVRGLPAAIDYAARVVCWFDEHLGRGGD